MERKAILKVVHELAPTLMWIALIAIGVYGFYYFLKWLMNKDTQRLDYENKKRKLAQELYTGLKLVKTIHEDWWKEEFPMLVENADPKRGKPKASYPKFEYKDNEIMITLGHSICSKMDKQKAPLADALRSAGFIDNSIVIHKTGREHIFKAIYQKDEFYVKSIAEEYDRWLSFVKPYQSKDYTVYAGMPFDTTVEYNPSAIGPDGVGFKVSLAQSPHSIILGTTGTGKTKMALSFLEGIMALYPDTEVYVADFKKGQDFTAFNEAYGEFKEVAKSMKQLDNLTKFIYEERYEKRQRLFEEASKAYGINCSSLVEYNELAVEKGFETLGQVVLVIDELSAGIGQIGGSTKFEGMMNEPSSAMYLKRLLAEARAVGVRIVFITQNMADKEIPRVFLANITNKFIHRLDSSQAGIADAPEAGDIANRTYILRTGDLPNTHCKMFYVGSHPKHISRKVINKKEFDENLILKYSDLNKADFCTFVHGKLFDGIEHGEIKPVGSNFAFPFEMEGQNYTGVIVGKDDVNKDTIEFLQKDHGLDNLVLFAHELKSKDDSKISNLKMNGIVVINEKRLYDLGMDVRNGRKDAFYNHLSERLEEIKEYITAKAIKAQNQAEKEDSNFHQSKEWRAVQMKTRSLLPARCMCCGTTQFTSYNRLAVDHVEPQSLNPERRLDLTNMQLLCEECNKKKGTQIIDFRTEEEKEILYQASLETHITKADRFLVIEEVIRTAVKTDPNVTLRQLVEIFKEKGITIGKSTVQEHRKRLGL